MKKTQRKPKAQRKAARPLLLAIASATTLFAACGDESTSGNLMAIERDFSASADMAQPADLSKPADLSTKD